MKTKNVFYGWIIAFCCMLSVCGASLLSTGMSTNLNAMRQCLGLTHTQTSMILTVRSISAFVVALFAEKYYQLLGVKKGMIVALAAGIFSFAIFSLAGKNMLMNYVGAAAAGICYSYGMMMPASMLLKNWFHHARGTALSIASCGTGLVSIVFAPVVQTVVNNNGLMAAFVVQGGVLLAVLIVFAIFVVETPEKIGLEPYGGRALEQSSSSAVEGKNSLSKRWSMGLFLATALIGMSASPCSANYTNNLVTAGLDPMDVARTLAWYGFILICSKLLFGRCIDKLGVIKTTVLFGILCTGGMYMLVFVNHDPTVPVMSIAMLLIGTGAPVQTLGYPNWVAELDSKNYTHTLERCQIGYQFGCVVGSPIPGILADRTGNYGAAYTLFTACTIVALLVVLCAFHASKKL